LKSKIDQLEKRGVTQTNEEEEENAEVATSEEVNDQEMKEVFEGDTDGVENDEDNFLNLFSKCKFYLSREVMPPQFHLIRKKLTNLSLSHFSRIPTGT